MQNKWFKTVVNFVINPYFIDSFYKISSALITVIRVWLTVTW